MRRCLISLKGFEIGNRSGTIWGAFYPDLDPDLRCKRLLPITLPICNGLPLVVEFIFIFLINAKAADDTWAWVQETAAWAYGHGSCQDYDADKLLPLTLNDPTLTFPFSNLGDARPSKFAPKPNATTSPYAGASSSLADLSAFSDGPKAKKAKKKIVEDHLLLNLADERIFELECAVRRADALSKGDLIKLKKSDESATTGIAQIFNILKALSAVVQPWKPQVPLCMTAGGTCNPHFKSSSPASKDRKICTDCAAFKILKNTIPFADLEPLKGLIDKYIHTPPQELDKMAIEIKKQIQQSYRGVSNRIKTESRNLKSQIMAKGADGLDLKARHELLTDQKAITTVASKQTNRLPSKSVATDLKSPLNPDVTKALQCMGLKYKTGAEAVDGTIAALSVAGIVLSGGAALIPQGTVATSAVLWTGRVGFIVAAGSSPIATYRAIEQSCGVTPMPEVAKNNSDSGRACATESVFRDSCAASVAMELLGYFGEAAQLLKSSGAIGANLKHLAQTAQAAVEVGNTAKQINNSTTTTQTPSPSAPGIK